MKLPLRLEERGTWIQVVDADGARVAEIDVFDEGSPKEARRRAQVVMEEMEAQRKAELEREAGTQ